MKLPRAILFDNDGVLSASEPLHAAAWTKLLAEVGLPCDAEDVRQLVGKTAPEILVELLNRHRAGWDPAQYDLQALARRKNDIYLELAGTQLKAYPGVREGLTRLKDLGIKTAVASNAKRRELETAMKLLQLAPLLGVQASRDDVPAPKPKPDLYLYAAACLEVEPEDCLVVEDSPPGLEAGLLAGMRTAAVLTTFKESELAQPVPGRPDLKPVWIGRSIQDFFAWIFAATS